MDIKGQLGGDDLRGRQGGREKVWTCVYIPPTHPGLPLVPREEVWTCVYIPPTHPGLPLVPREREDDMIFKITSP